MADDVRVTNMPNAGSHQAVALEMWKLVRMRHHEEIQTIEAEFTTYRRCLDAAYGRPDTIR